MTTSILEAEAASTIGALGLVVAMATLFTSEAARRLADATKDDYNPGNELVRPTFLVTLPLLVISAVAHVGLSPLVIDAFDAAGAGRPIAVLWMLASVWFLLNGLAIWQAWLLAKSCPLGSTVRPKLTIPILGVAIAIVFVVNLALWAL